MGLVDAFALVLYQGCGSCYRMLYIGTLTNVG